VLADADRHGRTVALPADTRAERRARRWPHVIQRCSYPGCLALTKEARCPVHRTDQRSPSSRQRGRMSARRRDAIRRAVLHRDHHICAECGARATQVDHTVPAARGGPFTMANLRAICSPCNQRKGGR
jgi:5-methylcytosine-specific restriction endonuclease McrA